MLSKEGPRPQLAGRGSGSTRPRWQGPSCLPPNGSAAHLSSVPWGPIRKPYRKAANSAIRTPSSAPKAAAAALPIPCPCPIGTLSAETDAALTWQPLRRGCEGRPWAAGSQLLSPGWRALRELQARKALSHLLTPGKQSRKHPRGVLSVSPGKRDEKQAVLFSWCVWQGASRALGVQPSGRQPFSLINQWDASCDEYLSHLHGLHQPAGA